MSLPGFRGITGHEDVIRYLKKSACDGRVSHALLITGAEGSGKRMIADAAAMMLVCETTAGKESAGPEEMEPCGVCTACKKAMDGNHPDIIRVTHAKPNVITVDEIRSQLVNSVEILPYESRYKVYIVADADKLNPQAQNALLKTIEEPPEYAVIILLANGPEALLPTVLSRCVKIALMPIADKKVEEYLETELQIPDYEARVLTAFAQGNIGKARLAAMDEAFSERRELVFRILKHVSGMNSAAVSDEVKKLKDEKDSVYEILDMILLWFRDVFYYKASSDEDGLVLTNETEAIRGMADAMSYEAISKVLDAADVCRVRLRANVNFDMALELLLFTIKECIHD